MSKQVRHTAIVGEPEPTSTMWLEIARIEAYELNPRRAQNPEYDRIKASVRAEGIHQPLLITSRPDSSNYILQAGGRTRLQILRELYLETGEQQFNWVECLFKPWSNESNVLISHLNEKELRGGLSFIDKAQAVFSAKKLLEKELGVKDLSQRRLETIFKEKGLSYSHSMISQMRYAVNTLAPLIPTALASGLGRQQIERIRALDRVSRQLWKQTKIGSDAEFDGVFAALCRRYDGPDWDINCLSRALENEIAEETELNLQAVRLELNTCLPWRNIEHQIDDINLQPVSFDAFSKSAKQEKKQNKHAKTLATGDRAAKSGSSIIDATELFPVGGFRTADEIGTHNSGSRQKSATQLENNLLNNLKSLRVRIWKLASNLAQRNGLGDIVLQLSDQGTGFILLDVPEPVADFQDSDQMVKVTMLWWLLATCSEITIAPPTEVVKHLEKSSMLRQALKNRDIGLLSKGTGVSGLGHEGHQFWLMLDDNDWQDFINLMDCYRQIHRVAANAKTRLWGKEYVL